MRKPVSVLATVALFFVWSFSFYSHAAAQTIYYVNIATGFDGYAGTSWGASFQNLTKAVAAAKTNTDSEVQIWVAGGIYRPTDATSDPYNADTAFAFYRGDGIGKTLKIYGGFAGTESSISERDSAHATYLDGNLGSSVNSSHVVVINGLGSSTDSVVVDGFTIRYGKASDGVSKMYNGYMTYAYSGAGVYMLGDSSTKILFRNCTISQNQVISPTGSTSPDEAGAGVYSNASNPAFIHCAIINNTCSNPGLATSYFIHGPNAYGAGLYGYSSNYYLEGCIINSNYAIGGSVSVGIGGSPGPCIAGLACGGGLYLSSSSASVNNCTFSGNNAHGGRADFSSAMGQGGGMYAVHSAVYVNNSVFNADTAAGTVSYVYGGLGPGQGGGMYFSTTSVSLHGCTLDSNMATAIYDAYESRAAGGGIYDSSSNVTADSCFFTGNTTPTAYAQGSGGGIYNIGSTCSFRKCNFSGNTGVSGYGSSYGGAINSTSSAVTYRLCRFYDNHASFGGGCYNFGGSADYYGCSFKDNASYISYGPSGGGIYSSGCPTVIDSSEFSGNFAYGGQGGAVCNSNAGLYVTRSLFSYNTATSNGGAVYVSDSTGYLRSDRNIFNNNSSQQGGGAISVFLSGSAADTITNSLFSFNSVSGYSSPVGGALQLNTNQHFVCNNTFFHDSSSTMGGSISCEGSYSIFKIANNIFYGSKASGTTADTSLAATYGSYSFYHNIYSGTQPLFADTLDIKGPDSTWGTSDDGLQLRVCSPAINTGGIGFVAADELLDITNGMRTVLGTVDIGAYQLNPVMSLIPSYTSICVGASVTLSDATPGGTWSLSDTGIAHVSTSGVVTGLAPGNDTINYEVSEFCLTGSDTVRGLAFTVVNVQSAVTPITGPSLVCIGSTTPYTDSISGGHWYSNAPGILSITSGGIATATASGTAVVAYVDTNICGISADSIAVTVQLPASTPHGPDSICVGVSAIFTDSATGGTWSTSNSVIASIDTLGNIYAATVGMDSVIYSVTNSCGSTSDFSILLVQRPASPLDSTDTLTICSVFSVVLSDSVAGGTWMTSDSSVATVTGSGSVACVGGGTAIITYTVNNACGISNAFKAIVVQTPAAPIAGVTSLCVDSTMQLTDIVGQGVWSVSNTAYASIDSTGLVTAIAAGYDSVYYTVNNACGPSSSLRTFFVEQRAGVINGSDTICLGGNETLTNSTPGGVWTVDFPSIASINTFGVINGLSVGLVTATYSINNSCGVSTAVKPVYVSDRGLCSSYVAENNMTGTEIIVYPDPVTDILYIKSSVPVNTRLITIGGTIINTQFNTSSIEVSGAPAGIYLLYIYDQPGTCVKICRIVKK